MGKLHVRVSAHVTDPISLVFHVLGALILRCTTQGLIDFAVAQSYMDTAAKGGRDKLDVLRALFTTGP